MNAKLLLSVLLSAFLVVGKVAHGATHDFAPESTQELVECQACHLPFSGTAEAAFDYFVIQHTTQFDALLFKELPNERRLYRSRAPPKF